MAFFGSIDIGTSSVKALIIDESGTIRGKGQKDHPLHLPKAGWAQQDPEDWCRSAADALSQALCSLPAGSKLKALSFSGQMHGLTALDQNGIPVLPAMIWMDQRSTLQQREIREKAGDLIGEELLNDPVPGMMICSLLWIKENDPESYKKIRTVLLPKDYVRYRLTGVLCSEPSDASSSLAYSVKNGGWCRRLLQRLDIDPELFPPVVRSTDAVGTVTKEAAALWGLSPDTLVVAGGGDAAMQLVGNGIVRPGTAVCNIGTASQFAVFSPMGASAGCCQVWCHAVPDRWYMQGGSLNGGSALRWLRNNILGHGYSFEQISAMAGEIPAGSEGLLFLPYLAGERTPYQNADARGVFFGLDLHHDRRHMARAVMEGITLNLLLCADMILQTGSSFNRLIAAGGGANGQVWRQIQSDVFGVPVYTNAVSEEACFGACLTAMTGSGLFPDLPKACDALVKTQGEPVLPIEKNNRVYREIVQRFRRLYEGSSPLFSS